MASQAVDVSDSDGINTYSYDIYRSCWSFRQACVLRAHGRNVLPVYRCCSVLSSSVFIYCGSEVTVNPESYTAMDNRATRQKTVCRPPADSRRESQRDDAGSLAALRGAAAASYCTGERIKSTLALLVARSPVGRTNGSERQVSHQLSCHVCQGTSKAGSAQRPVHCTRMSREGAPKAGLRENVILGLKPRVGQRGVTARRAASGCLELWSERIPQRQLGSHIA